MGLGGSQRVLHLFYYVILLRGYRHADLTVVYPLARGSGPLMSSLFAIAVLDEAISQLGVLGIAGVVLGVFLIAGGPGLFLQRRDAAAQQRLYHGLLYGVVTGIFIAGYTVVDGYGVKVLLLSPILIDYLGSCLRVVLLAPVALRNLPEARSLWTVQWRWALLVAVVSPIAYVLVLFAMQSAPISHVAPAREVSMLFAALIGGHLLKEGDRMVRIGGAILIALGVTALAIGESGRHAKLECAKCWPCRCVACGGLVGGRGARAVVLVGQQSMGSACAHSSCLRKGGARPRGRFTMRSVCRGAGCYSRAEKRAAAVAVRHSSSPAARVACGALFLAHCGVASRHW